MISDGAGETGDGFQIKSLNGVTSFSSDHNTIGVYNETIMSLTGHGTDTNRKVDITGELTANSISLADSSNVKFGTGNDMTIYHDGTKNVKICSFS